MSLQVHIKFSDKQLNVSLNAMTISHIYPNRMSSIQDYGLCDVAWWQWLMLDRTTMAPSSSLHWARLQSCRINTPSLARSLATLCTTFHALRRVLLIRYSTGLLSQLLYLIVYLSVILFLCDLACLFVVMNTTMQYFFPRDLEMLNHIVWLFLSSFILFFLLYCRILTSSPGQYEMLDCIFFLFVTLYFSQS